MVKLKAGLLPFYIKLYDDINIEFRKPFYSFLRNISLALAKLGVETEIAPICCIESEFALAIKKIESGKPDALITLHLAYSPSLESASILSKTKLPIIVLDTTPDFAFGQDATHDLIMTNHGIHGVQDMCNLLLRNGKQFTIEAGHFEKSDVLLRVREHLRGARLAASLRKARVGLIGKSFAGMGDFLVPADKLKRDLGITTITVAPSDVSGLIPASHERSVETEMAKDRKAFNCKGLDNNAHRQAIRISQGLERFIDQKKLSGFTLNFQTVTQKSGVPMMPFLGICKAMARGTGYAGEGDVLTAALVGSLMQVYPETSFTEMFCPDWKGGRIFLSHMGEINPLVAEQKPLLFHRIPWTFSDAEPPVSVGACFKPGKAVFVNLAPTNTGYALIAAPVTMISGGKNKKFDKKIRGWMKPELPLSKFLSAYSQAGGTHHAALVYGVSIDTLSSLGKWMGFELIILK